MVMDQMVKAAGLAAEAGARGQGAAANGAQGEMARLGMAAQLYAVKTRCECPSCQALRKMADITMELSLEAGVASLEAGEPPAPPPDTPAPPEEPVRAESDDPQPQPDPGS